MDQPESKGKRKRQGSSCPHCGDNCRRIPTPSPSPLEQVIFLQCNNVACGGVYRGVMTILDQDKPSLIGAAKEAKPGSDETDQERPPSKLQPAPPRRPEMGPRAQAEAAEAAERKHDRKLLQQYMRPTTLKAG